MSPTGWYLRSAGAATLPETTIFLTESGRGRLGAGASFCAVMQPF